ncbi:MAG: hypothetical protein JEY96_08970 [Bacteroidales bacterium]|nr:hypothetical protein [Bacteroidales bacterium]
MKNSIKNASSISLKEKNVEKYEYERLSFLSHISHGIRTPLNAIMGFSKLLVLKELVNHKQMKYIQGILNGGNLLMQFVDNLMDLSQFEADNYKVRIKSCDLNELIWDYTEDFYNHKIENNDTDISLMLVWDSKVKDLELETDSILFKKAIQRLVNIVSKKYPINEYELGYRIIDDISVSVFIRPTAEKLNLDDLANEPDLYSAADNDSFDFFNFKVLSEAVERMQGKLCTNSEKQEYSFCIPIKFNK